MNNQFVAAADDRMFMESLKEELRRNLAETHAADSATDEMKEALSAARRRHDTIKDEFGNRVASLERAIREEKKKPHLVADGYGDAEQTTRREQIRRTKQEELERRPVSQQTKGSPMVAGAPRNPSPQPRPRELHPHSLPQSPADMGTGTGMPNDDKRQHLYVDIPSRDQEGPDRFSRNAYPREQMPGPGSYEVSSTCSLRMPASSLPSAGPRGAWRK